MRLFAYSLAIGVFAFFAFVELAAAQDIKLGNVCEGTKCRACDLVTLAQNLVTWLIGISVFIAMLVAAFIGLKMVTTGEGSGVLKDFLATLVVGMIILLGSWLIIDTVMKMLLGGDFGPWNDIQCVSQTAVEKPPEPKWQDIVEPGVASGTGGPPGTGATGGPPGSNVDTVIKLADGTEEVRSGGTIAWRNNNPGNMISGIAGYPSVGRNGGFAVFATYEDGFNAMIGNLQTPLYQSKTVSGALNLWAPWGQGNDPVAYARFVEQQTGIRANTQMNTLSREDLVKVGKAIERMEGNRAGTVTKR